MKKLFLALSLIYSSSFVQGMDLFSLKLNEYSIKAKEISKKQITEDKLNTLVDQVVSIIDDLKKRAITEKLGAEDIEIRYSEDGQQKETPYNQKIIKFTRAIDLLHKHLKRELITEIIKKSPLEMVPIMKELDIFFKFISADPKDFGHGVFSEKQGEMTTILATNDAILRIMKVLVYTDLLKDQNKIHKLSRITTYFYNSDNISDDDLKNMVSGLKRNTADDSRIALYIPRNQK